MSMVDEGIRPEFIAIVNYGVIGLIQLALGFADTTDITIEKALNYTINTLRRRRN